MNRQTWKKKSLLGAGLAAYTAALATAICCFAVGSAVAAAESSTRQSAVPKANAIASSSASAQKRRKPRVAPGRPSHAQLQGLRGIDDSLDLRSSAALVIDHDTDEVLFSKNDQAVLPIASITKLMTAMVVVDAEQPLDEQLKVVRVALDTPRNNQTKLKAGANLTRGELLHLALMSSENRAAYALGMHYPGGLTELVTAMNLKAKELGMHDSSFVEPTGLSSKNQSSARDLALLVKAAYQHPVLRQYSTTPDAEVPVGKRLVQFRNTNSLVRSASWEIGLQKTGFISEAGRCLVMQAQLAGRNLIVVLLDSVGRYSRIADAERIRRWVADSAPLSTPHSAPAPAMSAANASPAVPESSGDLGRSGSDAF
jgi:serine-type D-Ala-D-Ala endopeptidase (penicillin-binding protein 7)